MHRFLLVSALVGLAFSAPVTDTTVTIDTNDAGLVARAPLVMTFDCKALPEICNSMCWGAFCTRPAFGTSLTFDAASEATKNARRKSAACRVSPANRCSTKKGFAAGNNCDEYPFASTNNADKGGQTNRCVPIKQNSSQGGIISNFIKQHCGCNKCAFSVGFSNPTAAIYCSSKSCIPDGNVFKGLKADVKPKRKRDEEHEAGGIYLSDKGLEVRFGHDMEIGATFKHAVKRENGEEERAMADAKMALERRDSDDPCNCGDGIDPETAPAKIKRSSNADDVPEFDFEEHTIVKKLS